MPASNNLARNLEREDQGRGPKLVIRANDPNWSPPAGKKLVLVDMDGTLADVTHRLHHVRGGGRRKNWKRFFEEMVKDRPNEIIAKWVRQLEPEYAVIIVSGRPANYARHTIEWLERYRIPFSGLLMRREGDFRADYIVKKEILDKLPKERIAFVIDDRASVCDMWRTSGLSCYQIAEGDF